jgi:hypothetical protein
MRFKDKVVFSHSRQLGKQKLKAFKSNLKAFLLFRVVNNKQV